MKHTTLFPLLGRCIILHVHVYTNALPYPTLRTRRQCLKKTLFAPAAVLGRHLGAGAVAFVDTLVFLAHGFGLSTGSTDGSLVTEVGVDADEIRGQTVRAHVLDDDFAWRLGLIVGAITAAAVQFASVHNVVVLDSHGSGTVVLDNLINGLLRSSTDDCCIAGAKD
ncbi:hypothetical protein B5807_09428 [Epicoccum nigrum]|uniref:Uncharacterized protein n=1 Tax=Epicoccum nigrum TaxID=105696 RepID=A0A1Y2LQ53_EPING|nr:hypothetical protein B5807_09428 [Epicoccum nigrum]